MLLKKDMKHLSRKELLDLYKKNNLIGKTTYNFLENNSKNNKYYKKIDKLNYATVGNLLIIESLLNSCEGENNH